MMMIVMIAWWHDMAWSACSVALLPFFSLFSNPKFEGSLPVIITCTIISTHIHKTLLFSVACYLTCLPFMTWHELNLGLVFLCYFLSPANSLTTVITLLPIVFPMPSFTNAHGLLLLKDFFCYQETQKNELLFFFLSLNPLPSRSSFYSNNFSGFPTHQDKSTKSVWLERRNKCFVTFERTHVSALLYKYTSSSNT